MAPLQYVILWHDGIREPHFDLMFETLPGSALSTWRSSAWPIESPTAVTRLKAHRRAYLEFEGELSERRGHVTRVGTGTCNVEVGEHAVWRVTILTGSSPQTLILRPVQAEHWEAAPA